MLNLTASGLLRAFIMSRTRYLLHYRTDVVENRGQSGPLIHPSITRRLWMNERGAGCNRNRMGTIASSERVGSPQNAFFSINSKPPLED